MIKVISTEKIPIKMWIDEIEEDTLEQAKHLANLPFAFKHIAIMPDCHLGFGMPIGGVMATSNVIVPNAVGVDIGCGMCTVKTSLTSIDKETLKKIMGEIRKEVPVGFNKHKEEQDEDLMPEYPHGWNPRTEYVILQKEYSNARKSLGTLGGGNHFIEIQKGSDGFIWIMIHSGSRNLGLKVADYYNKLAIGLNEKWHSQVPKEWKLAFLPVDSKEGQAYIREMNYCVEFALANRKLMMERIKDILSQEYVNEDFDGQVAPNIIFDEMINIAHNYASLENHFGQNVWVHRKGATLAKKGQIGIIPGSQGTASYIVKGLGNPQSFMSCSHGAGRLLGRKQAIKELDLKKEIKILDDQNIIHGIRNQNDLDESVSCYKDISEVIENQKDLVEVSVKLKPLAVIKG
jgi:tRNA-splicing ligase RtcB